MKCDTCKMKRVCDELERMGKVPKHEKCRCYTPTKSITNADRVRSLTDEELAELLTDVAKKSADKLCESLKTVEVDLGNCNFHILYEAHLDWLKQEAPQ